VITPARLWALAAEGVTERSDLVATEEPLEIRLMVGGEETPLAVTMRTPGADAELATGFLFAEGVVARRADIEAIAHSREPELSPRERGNALLVSLAGGLAPDLRRLERHFQATSACGVCGKASIDALQRRGVQPVGVGPRVSAAVLYAVPERLRAAQGVFAATGGLHAAALFAAGGELLALREDVGRHNAVDKLVGWALAADRVPLSEEFLVVSGRASFEIVQKAAVAGVPLLAAISAPSSLAVATARAFGMTLVGFLREGRCNVYCGRERVLG
jgi:FdhD protein